jgi:spermidine/putrescine transport system permease protein
MNRLSLAAKGYLTALYLFFYLPIVLLIVYSFNSARYSLVWSGFTWDWYHELMNDSDLWWAAGRSLILGIAAATMATVIGTLAAVCLYRYKFFGRKLQRGLIFILVLSPDIVMGIALLILFSLLSFTLGFWTLLCAHITLCLPFVVVTVFSRMISFDHDIFEAAKDLGAHDSTIFRRIILPLLRPAILSAWLLSLTLSFDDVIISYFVSGPEFEILPLRIYSMARMGITPTINALCTVTFGITLGLVLLSQLLLRKKP